MWYTPETDRPWYRSQWADWCSVSPDSVCVPVFEREARVNFRNIGVYIQALLFDISLCNERSVDILEARIECDWNSRASRSSLRTIALNLSLNRTWVHTRVWLSTRSCRFLSKTTFPRSDRFVWRRVRCFDILLCSVWVPSYLESETISWYAPTEPHTSLSSHPQLHPHRATWTWMVVFSYYFHLMMTSWNCCSVVQWVFPSIERNSYRTRYDGSSFFVWRCVYVCKPSNGICEYEYICNMCILCWTFYLLKLLWWKTSKFENVDFLRFYQSLCLSKLMMTWITGLKVYQD